MIKVSTNDELKKAISLLEEKQALQGQLLKTQLLSLIETLRPGNIIKNLYGKVTASPDLRGGIIATAIGLGALYLTRKTVFRSARNPFRKIFGSFLQLGITNIIARNPKTIKSMGHAIFDGIFHKGKKGGGKRSD